MERITIIVSCSVGKLRLLNAILSFIFMFAFSSCIKPDRKIKFDHNPAIKIDGFTAIPVAAFPYGKYEEKIGYNPSTGEKERSVFYLKNSSVDLLFKSDGGLYLLDWYNKNIKIIDGNFQITNIIPLTNIPIIYGRDLPSNSIPNEVHDFASSYDIKFENFYVNSTEYGEDRPNIKIKDYILLDSKNGQLDSSVRNRYFLGSQNIIFESDEEYEAVGDFLKDYIKKETNLTSLSFCQYEKDSLLFSFWNDKEILLCLLKNGSMKYLKKIPFKAELYPDSTFGPGMQIFSGSKLIYIFINKGMPEKFKPDQIGQLIILEKDTFEPVNLDDQTKIYFKDWYKFRVQNASIYTWDAEFNTKKFNIYRLEYTGDNPGLKEAFTK